MWTHPEPTGDIDLPVITTNFIPGTDHRRADFHELYWAYQLSETRAVAVLLWLYELACKGPRLKTGMRALWWCAAVFLAFLNLAGALLALRGIEWFADVASDRESLIIEPFLMLMIVMSTCFVIAVAQGAFKLAGLTLAMAVFSAALLWVLVGWLGVDQTETLAAMLLPLVVAILATKALMGLWGLAALGVACGLSLAFLGVQLWYLDTSLAEALGSGWLPWSLTSNWSMVAAWLFIAIYLVIYGAFLQPYLGDAARYFRNSPGNVAVRRAIRKQAVDQLEAMHLSGDYDRIVVVAHSLGTVVAYDMLRAYYSRVRDNLPDVADLGPNFKAVDNGQLSRAEARELGRDIVKHMAPAVEQARQRVASGAASRGDAEVTPWLVTDFVTMGSPLTHAYYLMCRGYTELDLIADFQRRTLEREFPTCPPELLDGDGWLTFEDPNTKVQQFHHGGLFALTRWTNLYFQVSNLLWGDAIGGKVAPVFGRNVADVCVHTGDKQHDDFFSHILYWDINRPNPNAQHIVTLQKAIDLGDNGTVSGM
jgi:hypothetical protein